MKPFKMIIIICVIVCVFSSCKSTTPVKTSNTQAVSPTKIITPTNAPTATPIPTPKPKMTTEEKSNYLYKLGKEYKNNNSAYLNRDEFNNSISIVIPSTSYNINMRGDNSEEIKIVSFIYFSGEEDSHTIFNFLLSCNHDELIFPEKAYFKTPKEKIELKKLSNMDPDIGLGYVFESADYEFENNEEIMKMYKLLKSKDKIRVRISGKNGDVDLTLNKQYKKFLLDGIDLYLKADKKLNN